MQYVSIDIETTGVDPQVNDIIEFAAVVDEIGSNAPIDRLQRFHRYIAKDGPYIGDAKALAMHHRIFERIGSSDPDCIEISSLMYAFGNFLQDCGVSPNKYGKTYLNVAGKNFGSFDMQFLLCKIAPEHWNGIVFRQRFLDPSIMYLQKGDVCVPDLATCVDRMQAESGERSSWSHHTAMDDALQVVRLIRHKFR